MDKVEARGTSTKIDVPGLAFSSNLSEPNDLPAPEIAGESTVRILSELGLSEDELTSLAKAAVIAGDGLPSPD